MASRTQASASHRILRVGVIQGGRIIEERILREKKSVSIGQSPRNSFVISSESLPSSFEVFTVGREGYTLKFNGAMDGRVTVRGKVQTLRQVREGGHARSVGGDWWHLTLEHMARGKLVIGDVTVLFQFVSAPPVQPQPRLPSSLRSTVVLGRHEPAFFGILAGSACVGLLFFALVNIVDIPKGPSRSKRLRKLIKSALQKKFPKIMQPKPMKATGMKSDDGMGPGDKKKSKTRRVAQDDPSNKKGRESKGQIKKGSKKYDALVDDLTGLSQSADDRFKDGAIARTCTPPDCPKGATPGVDLLAKGQAGGDLDDSAGRADGTASGPRGSGDGNRVVRGRGTGVSVRTTGGGGTDSVVMRAAVMKVVRIMGRVSPLSLPKPMIAGGGGAKVRARVRQKVWSLKSCYNAALIHDSKLSGTVRISISILPSGRVSSATVVTSMGGGVKGCVRAKVRAWFLGKIPHSVFYTFSVNFKPG